MKLSVSNIAWGQNDIEGFLRFLVQQECNGLELSASTVWQEPVDVPRSTLGQFKKTVKAYNLEIPSAHSLTYTRPDLSFFESEQSRMNLVDYVRKLGEMADVLEIPVMVFGSAKSRQIGNRNRDECMKLVIDTFSEMAKNIEPLGVTILIEPLSKMETDCINNADEAMEIIRAVNHKNLALHLDLKSSFAEQEDLESVCSRHLSYIKHCHVSDPAMKPPSKEFSGHYDAAKAIKKSGYDKYISLEIKKVDDLDLLRESLTFVKDLYL